MENEIVKTEGSSLAKFRALLSQDVIKKKFEEALGKKAPMFVSNLTTIMGGSAELQKCDHLSVISSALMAASMDLPLTPGLGFAGIVPYFDGPSQQMKAQFQVMKKGFIQLAQRTGLFKIINVSEVYEGELKSHNKFTGEYIFDEAGKKSDNVIGYVSYFRLINGFEKYYYMPIEKLDTHAKRYSKSFQRGKGKWADKEAGGYEQMCEKTVLKLNLSTYAPLSVDINMMNAIVYDQAEIRDVEGQDYDYVDNEDSRKLEEKDVIDKGDGKQIVINKTDASKSEGMTSRAVNKINPDKFVNQNIQDATVVDDKNKNEPPFKIEKGSVEYKDGKVVSRDGESVQGSVEAAQGNLTLEAMEKMDTEILKVMVMDDLDMMEASEIIPGKNTNKKLREIIFAYQSDDLAAHVAPHIKDKEKVTPEEETGEIPVNKSFDKEKSDKDADEFLKGPSKSPEKEKDTGEAGNKYNLDIPSYDKGQQREFATTKTLYNRMVGVTPQITTLRYLEVAEKTGLLEKYADKEAFCRDATVEEINQLLNAN